MNSNLFTSLDRDPTDSIERKVIERTVIAKSQT